MKKITLTIAMLTAVSFAARSQRMMGVATGNWCGTNSITLNPSSIADSRTRFSLDLFSLNLGIDNNLASIDVGKATKATSGVPSIGDVFTFSKSKNFSVLLPVADVHLPGIMVSIDQKQSVAITTRLRVMNQFNNFDQNLLRAVMDPAYGTGGDVAITSQKFNWTAHMWTEMKLTYAREVYNKDEHYVKAGISLTRLGGLGFLSLKGNNLDGKYFAANDSIRTNNTDVQFATSAVDKASELTGGLGDVFGQFFGKKGGRGWGADLGATYEYRPDETNNTDQSSNKYKVRASIAITDLGSVKYDAVQAKVTANGSMSTGDLAKNFMNFSSFSSYAASRGYTLDTGRSEVKVKLPTSMIIGVDYFVARHFYVNATWITNMANRTNYGNSVYGQLTVTPRWDTRYFSVALPLAYSGLTKGMKAGLGFRAGGLMFGSDDMMAFIGAKTYGMNFYFGGYIPINKKHKKSHDKGMNTGTEKTNG